MFGIGHRTDAPSSMSARNPRRSVDINAAGMPISQLTYLRRSPSPPATRYDVHRKRPTPACLRNSARAPGYFGGVEPPSGSSRCLGSGAALAATGLVRAISLSPYEDLLTAPDNRPTMLRRDALASCMGFFPCQASVTSARRGELPHFPGNFSGTAL